MTSLRWNLSWLSSTPPTEKKVTTMSNKIEFDIANSDGNAFALIGGWKRAAHDLWKDYGFIGKFFAMLFGALGALLMAPLILSICIIIYQCVNAIV